MSEEKINQSLGGLIADTFSGGKTFACSVLTSSMKPLIQPNDKIVISRMAPEGLMMGDIIVFKRQSEFYVHRLLAKKRQDIDLQLITKGDNAWAPDAPVNKEDFLGKVIAIKKSGQSLNLENKFWKTLNVLLGVFFFSLAALYNYLRRIKSATRI